MDALDGVSAGRVGGSGRCVVACGFGADRRVVGEGGAHPARRGAQAVAFGAHLASLCALHVAWRWRTLRGMLSYFKLRGSMTRHGACAICATRTKGPVTKVHIAYGVRVQLCTDHASVEFRHSRAGRDLLMSLLEAWKAAGCWDARHSRAWDFLAAQIRHELTLKARDELAIHDLPGSYRCPEIRRAVEQAIAQGESRIAKLAELVATLLKAELRRGRIKPPSLRTLRRWRQERRWQRPGWQAPVLGTAAKPT